MLRQAPRRRRRSTSTRSPSTASPPADRRGRGQAGPHAGRQGRPSRTRSASGHHPHARVPRPDQAAAGCGTQLGGPGRRGAGSGVVVGVIDTGLWPESPSVAPLRQSGAGAAVRRYLPDRRGSGTPADCTTKVVGARYYTAGVTAGIGDIKTVFPYEYLSPRDADGHGTHTSTTAAGNYGVPVDRGRPGLRPGQRHGAATPGSRRYKVCWGRGEPEAGCYNSDSVQAIEDATTDGVDVINFSISGSLDQLRRPGRARVLRRRRGGRLRRHLGRQQRARARAPSRTTARG